MSFGKWAAWMIGVRAKRCRRLDKPLSLQPFEPRALLAAAADLVAFRPVVDHIDFDQHPVAASVEADFRRGPGVRINGDDDNASGVADYHESSVTASEDDLVRVDVTGSGDSLTLSWRGALRVWDSPTKGPAARVFKGDQVASGQSLWVEYVSQTHTAGASTVLTLRATEGAGSASDSIVFHSFQSVVIVIGGRFQNPANFGDPDLGVYTIGGTLYDQGYDVHLFAHGDVNSAGQGAAFNEVASSVQSRNVDYVAIVGYSRGGGATHDLASALRNSSTLAGKYQLSYTAAIDGIQNTGRISERRLPPLTVFHDNIYQRKDWLTKGDSVPGASNLNVTTTSWGKNLIHTTIDDSPTVQAMVVTNLTAKVIAAGV